MPVDLHMRFWLVGLVVLTLAASAGAQTQRSPDEIRNEIRQLQAELRQAEQATGESYWARLGSKLQDMLPDGAHAWVWFVIGMTGEVVFFFRFVIQWWASERRGRTVVPMSFWYMSLIGTLGVLAYALYRVDPVFILAYSLNILIYVRNMHIARRGPLAELVAEKSSE